MATAIEQQTYRPDPAREEHDGLSLRHMLLEGATATRVARVFQALSDPTRLRIISVLAEHEVCVHSLTEALGMTQSAVSHQLSTMRQMRLVRSRKHGRHVYYTLDDEHVHDLFQQGLAHCQHG